MGALPEIWRLLQGAGRENILDGSSTDEQRSSSAKDRQPGGLFSGGRLAALLLGHRALWLCSLVAPSQTPARKQRAHSLFCYWLSNQLPNVMKYFLGAIPPPPHSGPNRNLGGEQR